jgi:hypothetical protein
MARKLSYKILLFNEKKKRIKPTHLSKAHYIEIWYGKRKILAKTLFPKVYFKRKKKASDKKKYLKDLIVKIEKKRIKAIEKSRKTRKSKKKKVLAKKRKRAIKAYRKRRLKKAQEKAKKVRKTKRQKAVIEEIEEEALDPANVYIEPEEEKKPAKVVMPVEYDEYNKTYEEYSLFSKRRNKDMQFEAMSINEKDPLAVTRDNIDAVMQEMRERYFPHFLEYIKQQGGQAVMIPKFNIDFNINQKKEMQLDKGNRLDVESLGVSTERIDVDLKHAKEAFEMLLVQFYNVLTGETKGNTRHGGNYLARSQNNVIYVTGFTTEVSDGLND